MGPFHREIQSRAARFLDYCDAIGAGEVVNRAQMAERMGVTYSTARYNLERAVSEGALNKQYGFATDHQPGYIYALPETMPRLEGM